MPDRNRFQQTRRRGALNGRVWIGLVAGVAALLWVAGRPHQRVRRFADRAQERRNPMHFFLAGRYPHRRRIDRSGTRPLFERRQSVYDAY